MFIYSFASHPRCYRVFSLLFLSSLGLLLSLSMHILLAPQSAQADNIVLLSESFDDETFPPIGWGTTIVTGTTQGWSRVTSGSSPTASPHRGAGMAQFNSFSIPSGDSTRLYTPLLDLTGQTAPTLKFWMYHYPSSYPDRIQVELSTDGGANYTTVLTTVLRYNISPGWMKHVIDLSAYIGQSNVRLGFLAISDYGNNMFIDDVSIGPPAPDYSGSITSIQPAGLVYYGQQLTYTIVLSNSGDISGTATTLHDPIPIGIAYVNGTAIVQGGGTLAPTTSSIDWSGTVTNGQSVTLTFQVTVTAHAGFVTNTATIRDSVAKSVVKTAGFSIAVVDAKWPMQGHDARRTSLSAAPGPLTPTLRWTYDFGVRLQDNASPVIGPDGTIYIPTEGDVYKGNFFAVNPNGTLKWEKMYALGNAWDMRNAPALSTSGDIVYVLGGWLDQEVRALKTQNGDVLWQFPVSDTISYSSFAVGSDGTIYLGTWQPALYAINPDGTLKWRYDSPSSCAIETPPAVDTNGNVYFVHNCVGLVALDSSGNLKWSKSGYGDYGWPTPLIGTDGTIYVAGEYYVNNHVSAFNPDGTLKWERTDIGAAEFFAGLAISSDGSTLYTGRGNGMVYALNTSTGATVWSAAIPGATWFGGSPALSENGILYLVGGGGTSNGWVFAVSAFDGILLWKYELNSGWVYWGPQSPAIGPDGVLYAVSSGGIGATPSARLYAFGPVGVCPSINVSPTSLPGGIEGIAYSQVFIASGGRAPYIFAQTDGIRPPGLTLSTTGILSGTPNASGLYTFTITAADANGCTGSQIYTTSVIAYGVTLAPPTATQPGTPGGTVTYTLTLTNTGNASDSYTLTKSKTTFTTTVTPTSVGLLSAGASRTVTVAVQIPMGAVAGVSDTATITAASQADVSKTASSTLTTTVNTMQQVYLPLICKQ